MCRMHRILVIGSRTNQMINELVEISLFRRMSLLLHLERQAVQRDKGSHTRKPYCTVDACIYLEKSASSRAKASASKQASNLLHRSTASPSPVKMC